MARPDDPDALDAEIAALGGLSLDALKLRFLELRGVPLPKFMRRDLMTRAVAHALQEHVLGGLERETQKRLDRLVRGIVPSGDKPPPAPNRVKTGTRLVREWQGQVHEVTVTPEGFVWNGEPHRSLSRIARLITGTRWNGWVFFGIKKTGPAASRSDNDPPTSFSPSPLTRRPESRLGFLECALTSIA